MKLGGFIRALQTAGVDTDLTELREILWLASQLTPQSMRVSEIGDVSKAGDSAPFPNYSSPTPSPATMAPVVARQTVAGEGQQNALYAGGGGSSSTAARRLLLRGASALPNALLLGRALKPLSRRRLGSRLVLDERATAEFIAETGVRSALWRPERERWFDVVLAVEDTPSLTVWIPLVSELERLIRRQGGFSNVRRMRLTEDSKRVYLSGPDAHEIPIPALVDRHGRRIVLVLSDCTSDAWRDGRMGTWLQEVSQGNTAAIVQLLPQSLWPNTSIGFAELRSRTRRVGTPTAQSSMILPSWALGEPGVAIPVLALEPRSIADWARMVVAAGDAWATTALIPLPLALEEAGEQTEGEHPSTEQRAKSFQASATPGAQRLAAYFSVVKPLTTPVMRIIQRAMSPTGGAVELAQVYLGGMLSQTPTLSKNLSAEEIEYDFYPGLREMFNRGLTRREFIRINQALHDLLQQQAGTEFDFFALLEDPAGSVRLPAIALPFAQFSRTMASKFGLAKNQAGPVEREIDQLTISRAPASSRFSFVHQSKRGQLTLRQDISDEAIRTIEEWQRDETADTDEAFRRLAALLVPVDLQNINAVSGSNGLVELVLDEQTARYPWEVMFESSRGVSYPLAVDRGMSRRPFAPSTRLTDRATGALVIGDIEDKGQAFPQLPGAHQEAKEIAALLSRSLGGQDVVALIGASAQTVVQALMAAKVRVLHIAVHSALSLAPPDTAGSLDISERVRIVFDQGTIWDSGSFKNMAQMPELVFLGSNHGAALAPALLAMGAQVVVAPVGSLDDASASTFAIEFFERLSRGAALIEAVRAARLQCFRLHPSEDTWGRFQCYGDAAWRLADADASSADGHRRLFEEEKPAAPSDVPPFDTPERQFQHNAFVVYAISDDEGGWVTDLINDTRNRLHVSTRFTTSIYSSAEIEAGAMWSEEIERAINSSRRLVVVLSEAFYSSQWCTHAMKLYNDSHGELDRHVLFIEIEPMSADKVLETISDSFHLRFWTGEPIANGVRTRQLLRRGTPQYRSRVDDLAGAILSLPATGAVQEAPHRKARNILISSTRADLSTVRDLVTTWAQDYGHHTVRSLQIAGSHPVQEALENVANCDALICIVSSRYGYVPDDKQLNPARKSLVELELQEALRLKKPVLSILQERDDAPTAAHDDLVQFRERLASQPLVLRFRTESELERNFPAMLAQLTAEIERGPKRVSDPNEEELSDLALMKGFVLVAGTGRVALPAKTTQTAEALGAALARAGYGLITGGWPGVDAITSRRFCEELDLLGQDSRRRLVQTTPRETGPLELRGTVVKVSEGAEEYSRPVALANFVVLIGGEGGTIEVANVAEKAGKVICPLRDTGGDAKTYHARLMRRLKSTKAPNLSAAELARLAGAAPGVVEDLMEIFGSIRMAGPGGA